MTAFTKSLLIILCASFFISCQKEISAEFGTTNTGGGGTGGGGVVHTDSVYLEKYTQVYDAFTFIDSTIYTYQYDTFRRVISGTYNEYQGNVLASTYNFTYYYNGADTTVYKYYYLGKAFIYNYPDTTTGFVSYDASGRLIYDSSINSYTAGTDYYKEKTVDKRQYTTANVYFDRVRTALVQPVGSSIGAHYKDTGWLDARKNVIRCSSYDYYNSPAFPPLIVYTGIFTYDNKPSPFSFVNIYDNQVEIPGEKGVFVPQRNNCLSNYTENYYSGQPPTAPTIFSLTYTHTFNAISMVTKTITSDNTKEYYSYRAF